MILKNISFRNSSLISVNKKLCPLHADYSFAESIITIAYDTKMLFWKFFKLVLAWSCPPLVAFFHAKRIQKFDGAESSKPLCTCWPRPNECCYFSRTFRVEREVHRSQSDRPNLYWIAICFRNLLNIGRFHWDSKYDEPYWVLFCYST